MNRRVKVFTARISNPDSMEKEINEFLARSKGNLIDIKVDVGLVFKKDEPYEGEYDGEIAALVIYETTERI